MSGRTIGFAVTGSFCTHEKIKKVIEELVNQGEKVIPVFSPICQHTDSRFGKCEDFIKDIQKITKEKGIFTIPEAEPIGPKALLDVLVIAPCTGNTLAKLSAGIADSTVLMAAKAHLRNDRPVVIGVSTNDGLGANFQNIGSLMNRKNMFFIPFGQDDFISVCDSYNNCRTQNRIFLIAAGRAFHHTFFLAVNHWFSTAATVSALAVPLEELMPCNSCKCKMLWLSGPKNPYILKFIVRKQRGIQLRDQVETLIIYGKQINKIVVKISDLFLQLPETWESNICIPFLAGKKYTAFFVCKDKAVFIRGRRFVFVVISMWCDVLNHIVDILFFILL